MRFWTVMAAGWLCACSGAGGDGDLAAADSMDLGDEGAAVDAWAETQDEPGPDVLVQVGREVVQDLGGKADIPRDIPRDVPADVRDIHGGGKDVVRDIPFVHRDTGADSPSRDTHKE